MPEQPPPKRRKGVGAGGLPAPLVDAAPAVAQGNEEQARRRRCNGVRYAELHCRSNFSFLTGGSHPSELVERAAALGYAALAIVDQNSLAGIVRAHTAAKDAPIHLLVGAELSFEDAAPIVVWATDRASYGRLCRLLTIGRRRAEKGACRLFFSDLVEHSDGLLAGALLRKLVGPTASHSSDAAASLRRFRALFGDRGYALAEISRGPDDRALLRAMADRATAAGLPLVAANDVVYHAPERRPLQDVLTAIREGCTVAEAGDRLFENADRHLREPEEMAELFADYPDALRRTIDIADRCTFRLDELKYEYPEELAPAGLEPFEHLRRLVWAGARGRFPHGVPERARNLIEHELALIAKLKFEPYFLTVWDLVRFARTRGILCQGRGSAANSVACYCLGVTAVDPDRVDLLFERFVSEERNEAPDIDIDFEHERREEVLQYIYEKYGRDRAGMTAVVITYRPRSAVRDVGKALGYSPAEVDSLAKAIEMRGDDAPLEIRFAESGFDPTAARAAQLIALVRQLVGFPRHLSQHTGGMVMTRGPLCELSPIENAAMPDRTVIQWDKDDLDDLGILKVDCLCLGMLTAIRKCFGLIARHWNWPLGLATVPPEDPAVYAMIQQADTVGVFQIESRAQMSMLPRLKPACYYDLVIEVAIVRPGPIQGDMVHPYLRRREGLEAVDYPSEAVRAVLQKTLGVPLFQEQAMRLAVVAAGFTPGEADQLRRAMGAWRRPGIIDRFHRKLIDGMGRNGIAPDYAERVYKQICGFGEYGFPESHAASFALLVYVSAWLKRYFPEAFTASIINSLPMGFYAPAQLIRDAREHGIEVLPVDVNHSEWDMTLEPPASAARPFTETGCGQPCPGESAPRPKEPLAIRLGFRLVSGLSAKHGAAITAARAAGAFASIEDFARRTGVGQAAVARLARANAFGSVGDDRRASLWQSLAEREKPPLFADLVDDADSTPLAPMAPIEEVLADYRMVGMSLVAHPISFCRPQLRKLRAVQAIDLKTIRDNSCLRVGGLVLMRQQPATARGIRFVTLEDETGIANLVVRPHVWDRFRKVAHNAQALLAHGRLERRGQIIHVLVHRLDDLTAALADLKIKSRDFR